MMPNHRVALAAVLLLAGGLAAGPAAADRGCPKGLKPITEFRMFFGLADAAGKTVTEEEWQRFLADTITPRFRAGLTVLDARGQWQEPSGNLQREPVKLVIGAVSTDAERTMTLVDEISAEFEARFEQDPVFRMSRGGCSGIYEGP